MDVATFSSIIYLALIVSAVMGTFIVMAHPSSGVWRVAMSVPLVLGAIWVTLGYGLTGLLVLIPSLTVALPVGIFFVAYAVEHVVWQRAQTQAEVPHEERTPSPSDPTTLSGIYRFMVNGPAFGLGADAGSGTTAALIGLGIFLATGIYRHTVRRVARHRIGLPAGLKRAAG